MVTRNGNRIIDKKWEEIFNNLQILEHLEKESTFLIDANTIRKYKEPRLMTKFDHKNSLPDIFYENNINILPISRGKYIIGKFNAYGKFEKRPNKYSVNEVSFPYWVKSIQNAEVTSEPEMLSIAEISGMYNRLLGMDENENLYSTVNGRMGSGVFDFNIQGNSNNLIPINVNKSQIEIDGGYESVNTFLLVEAKAHIADTFLIRQLYYPYRVWKSRLKKTIIPVYLQYDNGIYNFSKFEFKDVNNYSSINLVDRKNFVIGNETTTMDEIVEISKWAEQNYVKEPSRSVCVFPQANSLQKIFEIINLLNSSDDQKISKEQLTLDLDFVYRQADYYANAGKYIGIFNLNKDIITFTNIGEKFYGKSRKQQQLLLTKLILRHKPFNLIFKNAINDSGKLKTELTYNLIKANGFLSEYNDSTIRRRVSTINSWLRTISDFINDY